MTLGDIKKRALALIEALDSTTGTLTDDVDFQKKINYVVDQIQTELATIKPIIAKENYVIASDDSEEDLPTGFFRIEKLNAQYFIYADKIVFSDEGTYDMYYSKFPTQITSDTLDTVDMELTSDCLNAMPYGIASDMLKADISVDYTVYANRYEELKNQLLIGTTKPSIVVDTSVEYE